MYIKACLTLSTNIITSISKRREDTHCYTAYLDISPVLIFWSLYITWRMIGFRNHITVDVLLLVLWRITKSWAHHLWGRHLQAKIIVQSQVPTTELNSVVPTKLLMTLLHILEYNKTTIHVYICINFRLFTLWKYSWFLSILFSLYQGLLKKKGKYKPGNYTQKTLVNTRWWFSFENKLYLGLSHVCWLAQGSVLNGMDS